MKKNRGFAWLLCAAWAYLVVGPVIQSIMVMCMTMIAVTLEVACRKKNKNRKSFAIRLI